MKNYFDEIIDRIPERYKLVRVLGQGSFGLVLLLEDCRNYRKCACKIMDLTLPGSRESYENEVKYMNSLKISMIPSLYDTMITEASNMTFGMIFMEYLEGITLDDHIRELGVLPQEKALQLIREIATLPAYLSSMTPPLVYRDLKPENIILDFAGNIRILDLGSICPQEYMGNISRQRFGTPGFSAPELWDDCEKQRGYCDIYSLGAILHYMLTGVSPCNPPYRPPELSVLSPHAPASLSEVIERARSVDPRDRYQDTSDFLKDISNIKTGRRSFRKKKTLHYKIADSIWYSNKKGVGLIL